MNVIPRVAMLSFSNFGSTQHPLTEKVRKAVEIIKKKAPNLVVEGEIMADTALDPDIVSEVFPFSEIKGDANVLICPDLTSANIAYKVLAKLGGATAIGPMLLGIRKTCVFTRAWLRCQRHRQYYSSCCLRSTTHCGKSSWNS